MTLNPHRFENEHRGLRSFVVCAAIGALVWALILAPVLRPW